MKKTFCFLFALSFSFFAFGTDLAKTLPAGLSFKNRYFTEEELSELYVPEITFPHFEEYTHQCVINSRIVNAPLKKEYEYKSKMLIIENDKGGKQFFHFMIDSKEQIIKENERMPSSSRSQLNRKIKPFLTGLCYETFKFIAGASDKKCGFNITTFGMRFPEKDISMMTFCYRNGNLFVNFYDIPSGKAASAPPVEEALTVDLGKYDFGTEVEFSAQYKEKKLTVNCNGKTASYEYSKAVPENMKGYFNFGIAPFKNQSSFIEMFVSDLDTAYGM